MRNLPAYAFACVSCKNGGMLKWQSWDIAFWPGGWVRATDKTGITVVLNYRPHGEGENLRLRLHTTLMTSAEPITARRWREVPLAEIEEHLHLWQKIRHESWGELVRPAIDEPFSVEEIMRWLDETPRLKIGGDVPTMKYIDDEFDPHTPFETVKRPEGGRITDEFLENLAAAYKYLVARGEDAPARIIGEGAKVPVPTVHRWIARARERGFLPPAVKGRAG